MNIQSSEAFRDIVGGFLGAVIASALSAMGFVIFIPLPPISKPHDHTREALLLLVIATFLAGAFVGRRAISADGLSDMGWTFVGIYSVLIFLCCSAGVTLAGGATLIGLASVGFGGAAWVGLILSRRYPLQACE